MYFSQQNRAFELFFAHGQDRGRHARARTANPTFLLGPNPTFSFCSYTLGSWIESYVNWPGLWIAITRSLDQRSSLEIFRTAFWEACIGETVAAVEALSALVLVEDDAVRSVLSRIAEDEARHAGLGFRFVKWMLDTEPREVSRSLVHELEANAGRGAR